MSEYEDTSTEPTAEDTGTEYTEPAHDDYGNTIVSQTTDGQTIYTTDADGDGIADEVAIDADSDGNIDKAFQDTDGDGRLDTLLVDRDDDGYVDAAYSDTDGDGVLDTERYVDPSTNPYASP